MRALLRSLLGSMAAALAPAFAAAAPPLPAIFVANAGNNTIEVYNPPGGVGTLFDNEGASQLPYGLAVDAAGNLYVANGIADTIEEIAPSGAATTFVPKTAGLSEPTGLAFDSAGNLYVANYGLFPYPTIDKITPGGTVSLFATLSYGSGPFGMAFDGSGNLYVALSTTNAIDKITPAGTISTFATGGLLNMPYGLAFNPAGTLLFVADYENSSIVDYTPGGTGNSLSISGLTDGSVLNAPAGLAFDGSGDLYVANSVSNTIDEITAIAANGKSAHGTLFANTGLNSPYGIAYEGAPLPAPEPASAGLFATALLALATLRYRWRSSVAQERICRNTLSQS